MSGCPEGSMMKAFFYYDGPGLSGVVDEAGEFPGGTTQNVQFGAPVNGNYSVLVACTDYAGNYALNGETELTVPHGYINWIRPIWDRSVSSCKCGGKKCRPFCVPATRKHPRSWPTSWDSSETSWNPRGCG